jgi:hypothetical protein
VALGILAFEIILDLGAPGDTPNVNTAVDSSARASRNGGDAVTSLVRRVPNAGRKPAARRRERHEAREAYDTPNLKTVVDL